MGFDYGYTCGDIDKGIENFKSWMEDTLSDMLDECCPLLEGDQKNDFIAGYVLSLYEDFQGTFEDVRKCNEDIRSAAESQIDTIEGKIDDLEDEVSDLKDTISGLEDDLNGTIEELENERINK